MTHDKPDVIEITGRPRYADPGTPTKVTISNKHRDPLFVIKGGYLESRRDGEFLIASKHDNGTDFEHDSAYVAYLEGAGLRFNDMMGSTLYFSGVLMTGSWYDPDFKIEAGADTSFSDDDPTIIVCDDTRHSGEVGDEAGHLIMPFTPPKRKFKPQQVEITVEIGGE